MDLSKYFHGCIQRPIHPSLCEIIMPRRYFKYEIYKATKDSGYKFFFHDRYVYDKKYKETRFVVWAPNNPWWHQLETNETQKKVSIFEDQAGLLRQNASILAKG